MEATLYFTSSVSRYIEDERGRTIAQVNFGKQPILKITRNKAYVDAVFLVLGYNVRLDSARLFDGFLELNFKEVMKDGDIFQRWLQVTLDGDTKQLYEAYYTLCLEDSCDLEVIADSDDLDPDDFSRDED